MSATSSTPTRSSRRLALQFLAPTLAALAGMLLAAGPWVLITVEQHQIDTLGDRLLAEARLAASVLPWSSGTPLDAACARLGGNLGVRVTVIASDGRVLGESVRSSETLENHADRPEIRAALAGGVGRSVRVSATVGARLLYVAVRAEQGPSRRVVRLAVPLTAVTANVEHLATLLLAGLVVAAALGVAVAIALSRRLRHRVARLVNFTRHVAGGAPAPYLVAERPDELGLLEAQLGEMARRITETIGELRIARERLEAILRGMVEGVLVEDLDGRIVLTNARARELLDVPRDLEPTGRPLVELAREPALVDMARELVAGASVVSREVTLSPGVVLQVNAARLLGADGTAFGAVLVLHDVTELRRLEAMRRDFVANVSHELRTPLTAIKGYAETLLGPAGDDRETARRFLAIIDRHSERLGRLIDDLLTLSDLELGRTPLRTATVAIQVAVDDVVQMLADPAKRAGVTLEADVASGTPAIVADPDRFRQVLINLVDNAIKYTQPGGRVTVRAIGVDGRVEVAVEDTGVGIPSQALPRLAERFFRVDRARSRDLGGTGLGLAIVKHIVQAHGGELTIASELGRGTTVRAIFPLGAA